MPRRRPAVRRNRARWIPGRSPPPYLEDEHAVDAKVGEVAEDRPDRAAGMVEDQETVGAGQGDLLGEIGLDEAAPVIGAQDHGLLGGEVVAEPTDVGQAAGGGSDHG